MASGLDNIEHIVVVMFENRSFDNVLGWLYDPGNPNPPFNKVPPGQTFEGLTGVTLTNRWKHKDYPPAHGTDMTMPNPDPHEEYQFIYRQMFNPPGFDPNNDPVPDPPPGAANMTGFVLDYSTVKGANAPVIMDCFRPADVPVISQLAASFAVCDHWYAPVPSQTFTNRSFLHAGTASGYVNNVWHDPFGILINDTTTVQNVLDQSGVSFGIYYDSPTKFICNAFIAQERNLGYGLNPVDLRVRPMRSFYDALENGTLPQYSFIEPNFINNPWTGAENDEHPDAGVVSVGAASNVLFGEQFLADIYNALTASDYWQKTLLIITFDEHGGTFDHYPPTPATAIPPDNRFIPPGAGGYSGFKFDRYGVRVPAVLVSPWIPAGQVYNAPLDHTSAIKTIFETFGIDQTLGAREAAATDVGAVLNATSVRTDIPQVTPRQTPSFTADAAGLAEKPLTEFQQTSLILGARRATEHAQFTALADVAANPPETHADAWTVIEQLRQAEEVLPA
jgi:phospholipase C